MLIMAFGFSSIGIVGDKILDLISFRAILDDLLDFFAFGAYYFLLEIDFNIIFKL